ncbi:MAG: RNA polymerase-binding protein DksA [Nitrospira sp.]
MTARAPRKRTTGQSTAARRTAGARKPSAKSKYPDIRRALEKQRATLLGEVGEVLNQHQDQESLPDVSDQASAEVDQHFSMRIREREQKLLKKIEEALDRMKAGTYGICESCGEDIPYKRLKARPVTTLCIACKTQQEEQEQARR